MTATTIFTPINILLYQYHMLFKSFQSLGFLSFGQFLIPLGSTHQISESFSDEDNVSCFSLSALLLHFNPNQFSCLDVKLLLNMF